MYHCETITSFHSMYIRKEEMWTGERTVSMLTGDLSLFPLIHVKQLHMVCTPIISASMRQKLADPWSSLGMEPGLIGEFQAEMKPYHTNTHSKNP